MGVGASILQKIPVSRFVSISEGKVSWGLDPHLWSVHLVVRIQDFHSCHTDSNSVPTTKLKLIMGTFIILSLCVCLGWNIKLTIDEFEKGNKFYIKFIDVVMTCLLASLIVIADFISKENIKYQTMDDYFNGKIEVIQQVDTTRTFKFN